VITGVVSLLLHKNEPVPVAVNADVPSQLFTTVTTGAGGVLLGAAVPDPPGLVHPFIVCVTVYVPAVFTVIELTVALLLHNNDPVAVVVNVEVPLQLFTTVTSGVEGTDLGCAVPDPGWLVHPLDVCVTVYTPASLTVIDGVVELLLHNKVPLAVVDKVDVPSQLFITVTTGAGGVTGWASIITLVTGE
jgi:hypothetical protein